jgi:hypothetical protein
MSVAGYLASGKNAGLRSENLRARLKWDAMRAKRLADADGEPAEAYVRVEDYDPVLQAHCRVVEK